MSYKMPENVSDLLKCLEIQMIESAPLGRTWA